MIPKVIMQTSDVQIHPNMLIELKKHYSDEWSYYHYNDAGRLHFIKNNPLAEFPNMIELMNNLKGAHKADLFRYYFLYVSGGVYIDSDALLKINIDHIINDYPCDFFVPITTNSSLAFNGFLGCKQKSKVMYEVLKNAYDVNTDVLKEHYFTLCQNLSRIVQNNTHTEKIHLFEEILPTYDIGRTIDHNGKELLCHYWLTKVPKELL
jgi:mannosyltransferase OCH1-like enzyme